MHPPVDSDLPLDDETPRLGPSPGSPTTLQVTVRVGDHPLVNRTTGPSASILPDFPGALRASRPREGRFVVEGSADRVEVAPGAPARLREGPVELEVEVVHRFRLPRWNLSTLDPTVVVLILGVSLFAAQLTLLLGMIAAAAGGGGGGPEPSPEYLARLLRGEYDGAEQGVVAKPAPRPTGGDPIDSFYLQPGHAGPPTAMGGGKNVGRKRQIGDPDARPSAGAAPAFLGGEPDPSLPPPPTPPEDAVADAAEPGNAEAADAGDDGPVAVEVNEGWGFTDWYDTEDAREDAREIERELELAHQLLRLDPDDPVGLQIRAYYEYLAMDYAAARRTYQRFTELYPGEPAGWNNLALTYKRTAEYQQEEELYRIALALDPDDDAPINNLAVNLAHQGRYDEALQLMERLEVLIPGDPYADLHRAKIYAAMGKEERAYSYLQKALAAMKKLDTLHNIEFRQDIRLDPAFARMREQKRFRDLLLRYYGDRPEGWWQKLLR